MLIDNVKLEWKKDLVSKNGKTYEGLVATLPNGNSVLISINKVTLYTLLKHNKAPKN